MLDDALGWIADELVWCAISTAAVLVLFVCAGLIRGARVTFRCDLCRRRQPRQEYSGQGGWADWCRDCAAARAARAGAERR